MKCRRCAGLLGSGRRSRRHNPSRSARWPAHGLGAGGRRCAPATIAVEQINAAGA